MRRIASRTFIRRLQVSFLFLLVFCVMDAHRLYAQYTIGGTVVGLVGQNQNLVLENNGGNKLTVNHNETFTFAGTVSAGSAYNVTVSTLPSDPGEMCAVANGSGTATANVSNILVSCYSVSGTVSGLPPGQTITIEYNGTLGIDISSNGVFTFPPVAVPTTNYSVSVPGSPFPWGSCSVVNPTGTADPPPKYDNNLVNSDYVVCQANNAPPLPASQWTKLKNLAKDSAGNLFSPGTLLLLPDGSVLVNGPANNSPQEWLRLIPDSTGSYVNGTWTQVPNSICPHGFYASQVMSNGKVFIAGGEYPGPQGIPGCTGLIDTEIYDPSVYPAGAWTAANPPISLIDPTQPPAVSCPAGPNQAFDDMISESLPDGSVLMAPVCPKKCGDTLIYNPTTGWLLATFTLANTDGKKGAAGSPILKNGYGCSQQEDTWVKLRDGSILTADPPSPPAAPGAAQISQTSERFFPSQNKWVAEAPVGFALYDSEFGWSSGGEMGPAFLLPNGNALFVGASPVMGIYNPSTNVWAPPITIQPNGPATGLALMGAMDSPGTMMVNGKILLTLEFVATANNLEPNPAFFFEYDPSSGAFTEVLAQGDPNSPLIDNAPWIDCGPTAMVNLPDGKVLAESCASHSQLYVYTPSGSPLPQGQPQIQSISAGSGSCNTTCYHLTGAGLNGISEGASYGDDEQMATDFPLVRLTSSNGKVQYARTYNWTRTGLTPQAPGSTDFALPVGVLPGVYQAQVVVNGNASAPFTLSLGVCPPADNWDSNISQCTPVPKCPLGCKYGCIYTPPQEGNPPTLVCRGSPPPPGTANP